MKQLCVKTSNTSPPSCTNGRYHVIMLFAMIFFSCEVACCQWDTSFRTLEHLPTKYITVIDRKVDQYTQRTRLKTERSLEKLSRWEEKLRIKLQLIDSALTSQLYGTGQQTFQMVLQKIRTGHRVMQVGPAIYDGYIDRLSTGLKYLSANKENLDEHLVVPLTIASGKLQKLTDELAEGEALKTFINERKKQLIDNCVHLIGKSKYLEKINKKAWYYVETLRNYKEIFNEPARVEHLAKNILYKIPGFNEFMQENSMISTIFGTGMNAQNPPVLEGLQTNTGVQKMVQDRLVTGNQNAMGAVQQSLQLAREKLQKISGQITNSFTGNTTAATADFNPNLEKTKTFKQRLEYGMNVQYGENNTAQVTTIIAFSIGYKITNTLLAGIGIGYKLGMGTLRNVRLTNQGASIRSFLALKLKRQIFLTGGMELNYLSGSQADDVVPRKELKDSWQPSALIGIGKKVNLKTRFLKETKLQLLYDFMGSRNHPQAQSLLFRVGHNF